MFDLLRCSIYTQLVVYLHNQMRMDQSHVRPASQAQREVPSAASTFLTNERIPL